MNVIVDNNIIVENCTNEFYRQVKTELTLPNPQYEKAKSMGFWTGNIPQTITLYEKRGNDLILPFGCLKKFIFDNKQLFSNIISRITPIEPKNYYSNINLYDYQQKALNGAILARNGIIVAPCGAGKTQIGLAVASAVGGRTLWLTHTQDLLRQSMERAKGVWGLPISAYGTITAGKVNVGKVITFATVQTLSKINLANYRDYWDCVIVDEAHHCISSPTQITMFGAVVGALSARYKYGLTATPDRSDGLSKAMYCLLGDICVEIDKSEIADKTVPIVEVWTDTHYSPSLDVVLGADGTLQYTELINDLCTNAERNKVVADIVNSLDGATLVLSERVEHCKRLKELCNKKSVYLSASTTKRDKEERQEALKHLNAGEIDCVFATYQLAKEGLDCPNLKNLVMASPIKEKNTVTQSIGRVQRKADGKTCGYVYDFQDDFGAFYGMAKKRKNIYKKYKNL